MRAVKTESVISFKLTQLIDALHTALDIQVWLPPKSPERFLATGAPYAGAAMLSRYHCRGSLEDWILIKAEDPEALYEHASKWAEF